MMSQRRKPGVGRASAADQERRDQEVRRANKEVVAYFKGQRTEREARAALKIIKAFIRDRERLDARSRPPLPGASAPKTPKTPKKIRHRKSTKPRGGTVAVERPSPLSSESEERVPE